MPIYTYECTSCQHVDEVLHKMSEDPQVYCSQCTEESLRVILSAPTFVVPPHMSATPDKMKYYGIKDIRTGEGITENTDVRDPPGITARNKRKL